MTTSPNASLRRRRYLHQPPLPWRGAGAAARRSRHRSYVGGSFDSPGTQPFGFSRFSTAYTRQPGGQLNGRELSAGLAQDDTELLRAGGGSSVQHPASGRTDGQVTRDQRPGTSDGGVKECRKAESPHAPKPRVGGWSSDQRPAASDGWVGGGHGRGLGLGRVGGWAVSPPSKREKYHQARGADGGQNRE